MVALGDAPPISPRTLSVCHWGFTKKKIPLFSPKLPGVMVSHIRGEVLSPVASL